MFIHVLYVIKWKQFVIINQNMAPSNFVLIHYHFIDTRKRPDGNNFHLYHFWVVSPIIMRAQPPIWMGHLIEKIKCKFFNWMLIFYAFTSVFFYKIIFMAQNSFGFILGISVILIKFLVTRLCTCIQLTGLTAVYYGCRWVLTWGYFYRAFNSICVIK